MAPGAIQNGSTSNGTTLKATAPTFHPNGSSDATKYHAASSKEAISAEANYAAHNYHPLPVGKINFEILHELRTDAKQYSLVLVDARSGILKASTTSTSSPPTAP